MTQRDSETAALLSDLRDPRFDGPLDRRAADEIERLRAVIRAALGFHQVTHIHAALREASSDE